MDKYNRIQLKGSSRYDEGRAGVSFLPGKLIRLDSSNELRPHNVEGGRGQTMFAIEDALQGRTINDACDSGADGVPYILPVPGDEVFAYIAAGEDLDVGDELVSDGLGNLIAVSSVSSGAAVQKVYAQVMDAIDLSGSGAVASRTRVRIV